MRKEILKIISKFSNKKILVIGDTIVDKTTNTQAIGLSLESPTLKAKFINETTALGGAANVAQHLAKMGVECSFLTNISDVNYQKILLRENINLLQKNTNIKNDNIKHRFYVCHGNENYKHLQINTTNEEELNTENIDAIKNKLKHVTFDVIAFSDYNCCFINDELRNIIFDYAKLNSVPVYAASQVSNKKHNYEKYIGANYFSINNEELKIADNFNKIPYTGLYVTCGNHGSKFITKGKETFFKSENVAAKNLIGAGDAFYAAILACADEVEKAAEFGNIWASITIQKEIGEYPCLKDLKNF